MNLKLKILVVTFFAIIISSFFMSIVFAESSDISGHWTEKDIKKWKSKGLIEGYEDGTFRADNNITRAEFVALVNRAFGFTKEEKILFSDVSKKDWINKEVSIAKAAKYIEGYEDGTFKPENEISRQEAVTIIYRLLKLEKEQNSNGINKFKDSKDIPRWSKEYIDEVTKLGYIQGYEDGTFKPEKVITRAETITLLNRVIGELFNKSGVIGQASKTKVINTNVTISTPDVKLINMKIKGNLYLTAGIGEGNVELDNVIVSGKTMVAGGGEHSILIKNSSLGEVIVQKENGKVRAVAEGNTVTGTVVINSSAKLETQNKSSSGFSKIETKNIPEGAVLELDGDFENVTINTKDIEVVLTEGNINQLEVKEGAKGTKVKVSGGNIEALSISTNATIQLESGSVAKLDVNQNAKETVVEVNKNASIKTINLNAPIEVKGEGSIETANVNVNGTTIEQKPTNIIVAEGKEANISGTTITREIANTTDTKTNTPVPNVPIVPTIPVNTGGGGASTSTPTALEFANSAIATAKGLLPSSYTSVEGTNTNLLTDLNAIVGMSSTGVTLTLSNVSGNIQVASDGVITYGASIATGNVIVSIAKTNGTTDTKTISVTILAHIKTAAEIANESIATAKGLLPSSYIAVKGTNTNLLTDLNAIEGMAATGVTLTLETLNANVAEDGTITYNGADTAIVEQISENTIKICVNSQSKIKVTGYTVSNGSNIIVYYINDINGTNSDSITVNLATIVKPYSVMLQTINDVKVHINKASGIEQTSTVSVRISIHIKTVAELANESIATAKGLLPSSYTSVEGTNTNLLSDLNAIEGMAETGVTLTLETLNANVAENGTITYGSQVVIGNVIVHINKVNGTEQRATIEVTIPVGLVEAPFVDTITLGQIEYPQTDPPTTEILQGKEIAAYVEIEARDQLNNIVNDVNRLKTDNSGEVFFSISDANLHITTEQYVDSQNNVAIRLVIDTKGVSSDKVTLTAISKYSGKASTLELNIKKPSRVESITLNPIEYPQTNPPTTEVLINRQIAAYIPIQAYDQYGNLITDPEPLKIDGSGDITYNQSENILGLSIEGYDDSQGNRQLRLVVDTRNITTDKAITIAAVSKTTGYVSNITLYIKENSNSLYYGNIVGNITNGGEWLSFASQGDWVYYRGLDGLYKMKADTTEKVKLESDAPFYINVVGDWIYYTALGPQLYKIKIDGTNKTKLSPDGYGVYDVNVVDDWAYFTLGYKLYKMKVDGTGLTKLSDDKASYVNVVGDWVYYIATFTNFTTNELEYKLYKVRIDCSERTEILPDTQIKYINVVGDWIYFISYITTDRRLYKVKTDGSELSTVTNDFVNGRYLTFRCINVVGDTIYFVNSDEIMGKMNIDGSNMVTFSDRYVQDINIIGDWIYYVANYTKYRIKTDGTGKELFE